METTLGWIKRVTKDSVRDLLQLGIRLKRTHPGAFMFAKKLLGRFPWMDARIRTIMARHAGAGAYARRSRIYSLPIRPSGVGKLAGSVAYFGKRRHDKGSEVDLQDLPAEVRKVYLDLKRELEDRRF